MTHRLQTIYFRMCEYGFSFICVNIGFENQLLELLYHGISSFVKQYSPSSSMSMKSNMKHFIIIL